MQQKMVSDRQAEVLWLLADHLTIKEIAGKLGVSESAVNQRIKACKEKLNASNHRELIHLWRQKMNGPELESACSFSACSNRQLPDAHFAYDQWSEATVSPTVTFGDAMAFDRQAPWEDAFEPQVVPRALNGKNAGWVRGASIIAICVGFFAAILVGLGAAQGVTAAVAEWKLAQNQSD